MQAGTPRYGDAEETDPGFGMPSKRLVNRVAVNMMERPRPILPPDPEILKGVAVGNAEVQNRVEGLLQVVQDQRARIEQLERVILELMNAGNETRQRIADITEPVIG